MTTWDTWFALVLPYAPTAPDPLVRQEARLAAREFLRRTRTWMEWLEPLVPIEGTGIEYGFELPEQSQIVRIERATVRGLPVVVQNYREITQDYSRHPEGEKTLVTRDRVAFTLTGTFAAADLVQAQASLMPTLTATGIPDELAERHLEALCEGCKARLLAVPGTPYYSPDQASAARYAFEEAIAKVAVDTLRGGTNTTPRARPKWA